MPKAPSRLLAILLASAPLWGCASTAAVPVFAPLAPAEAQAALSGRLKPSADVARYLADARITHFARGQRTRAQLQLLVERPDHFRATVLSPQGPPLYVVACDGQALTSLDVAHTAFREVAATAEGLAELAPALAFSLPPRAFVQLLLGEVDVPSDARALQSFRAQRFAWQADKLAYTADFDRQTGRLLQLRLNAADAADAAEKADAPLLLAVVQGWDASGLPAALRLEAPLQRASSARQTLEVAVGHYNLAPTVGPRAFGVRP